MMKMNRILVDTSSSRLSVSLSLKPNTVHSSISVQVGTGTSEQLLDVIDVALKKANISLNEIDAFFVVVGPGSFTGVRIGIATFMGLAEATGKPLYGISSLDAAALVSGRNNVTTATRLKGKIFAFRTYDFSSGTCSEYGVGELPADEDVFLINTTGTDRNNDIDLTAVLGDSRFESFLCDAEPLYLRKSEAEINFDKKCSSC